MNHEKNELIDLSFDALSECSNLAKAITNFKVRDEQQKMAAAVAEAISTQHDLVCEAGTGIGKTFAYLVPALLSKRRTIVSTATRHLQDQIYFKDLPVVIDALDIDCQPALLKGRANYLCMERMKQATTQSVLDKTFAAKINQVEQWSFETTDGDISAMSDIAEDDSVWSWLTSTAENCLRKDCEYYDSCHVLNARQKAIEADVVIINHALLMADMTLKEEGFADFLPQAELIIVDEAHQLKDFAERNFTESFSSRQFTELLKEINELIKEDPEQDASVTDLMSSCTKSFRRFSGIFQTLGDRALIKVLRAHPSFAEHYQHFMEQGSELIRILTPYKVKSEQWENCIQRIMTMLKFIESVCMSGDDAKVGEVAGLAWIDRHAKAKTFHIYLSPVDISTLLAEKSKQYQANWVYTSATLSVKDDFSYFLSDCGDESKPCKSFASPFDYQAQAALYLPEQMPLPGDKDYIDRLMERVYPILSMSEGCALLLFTSYKALYQAEALLKTSNEYTLLVQNKAPKQALIHRFVKEDKTVLLGTSSFWNGIDLKGDTLRCLVIDRLPFRMPDPLLQAREAFYKKAGRDFFKEYVLPEAIITLRQGVGRLIRSETDMGVVVIGDPRLQKMNYGSVFLRSLPDMKRCHNLESLAPYLK